MKPVTTLLLASIALLVAHTQVNACDLNPTAVIDVYPGNDVVFFDGEYIYLEAYASTANCGYITVIEWQIDGVVVSNSGGFEPDFSLDQGEYNRRFDVQLTVGNSGANFDTINITIAIVSESKSYYYLKDHLGSVRVTVNDAGAAVGWDDYYPFGLQMPGRTQNASNPNEDIKFTGYELEQECETDSSGGCINDVILGLYHAEARMYDPVIGRFMQLDPLADHPNQVDKSPYAYAWNNPTNVTDPDGQCPVCPWLDAVVDVGFIFYDVGVLAHEKITTGKTSAGNWAALGADAASIGVPMTVGAGLATRAAFKAGKATNNGLKAGKWTEVSENMSDAAKNFQKQISGVDTNLSFKLNGVKFDGVTEGGTLLDAKSGMKNFVGKDGNFQNWFKGADGLVGQATRQMKAADGAPIQWHFEEKSVLEATQKLFKKNDLEGIELIHTKRQ